MHHLLALVLIDAGDVERGENVDGLQTTVGQRAQVFHAVRIEVREGVIGAAILQGHRGITDAEVANVELIDAEVVEAAQRTLRIGSMLYLRTPYFVRVKSALPPPDKVSGVD